MKKYALLLLVLYSTLSSLNAEDLLRARRDNNFDTIANSFIGYDSTLYTYDGQGRMTQSITMYWNATTLNWDSTGKATYVYHPVYGVLGYTIFFAYHSGVWDTTYEDIYQYATDTTLLHHTNYYDIGSGLTPYYREDYYYNAQKQVYQYLKKTYNTGTSTFDNGTEILYHFNGNNQNDSIRKLTWNTSAYVNSKLTVYLYNGQGLVNTQTDYSWVSGSWTNGIRRTFTYNAAGKQTEAILLYNSAGIWLNGSRNTYMYDNNIYLAEEDDYYWDSGNSLWAVEDKKMYNLNTNHLSELFVDSTLNLTSLTWYVNRIINSEYDADGNNTYYRIADYVNHLATTRNTTERYNWYNLTATAINDPLFNAEIKIYPIPASGIISTSLVNEQTGNLNISLYSLNGQLVKTIYNRTEGPGNVLVNADISTLPRGVYLIQISIAEHSVIKRIILQ